jgi:hypothetical protein
LDLTTDRDLREWFEEMNADYFDGRMSVPGIGFVRREPGVHGTYLNSGETGGRAAILISPSRKTAGAQACWDTLLHEAVHHYIAEHCCADDGDHGRVFCNVANEVAKRMGLPGRILPHSRKAMFWPGSLRY